MPSKLLVTESHSHSLLYPTQHSLQVALSHLAKDQIYWYITENDAMSVMGLFGAALAQDEFPNEMTNMMSGMVAWEALKAGVDAIMCVNCHALVELLQVFNRYIPTYQWAVDDPHEFHFSSHAGQFCNRTFTVEKNTVGLHKGGVLLEHAVLANEVAQYRSMAAASQYKFPDVVFMGSPYPNRVAWLNDMVPRLSRLDASVGIYTPFNHGNFANLDPWWKQRALSPVNWDSAQLIYASAKCVINIHREKNYVPFKKKNTTPIEAFAVNQTCFSVPALGGIVLCDDSRKEGIIETFGPNIPFFDNPDDMARAIEEITEGAQHPYNDMCRAAEEVIFQRHLWVEHRLPVIVETLKQDGVDLQYA